MKGRGNIIGILGLWLIVAGLWQFGVANEIWNNIFSGTIIAVLGFTLAGRAPGNGWISGLFGLWMIASAFIPGLRIGGGLMLNNFISGVIVAIAGFTVPSGPAAGQPRIRRAA